MHRAARVLFLISVGVAPTAGAQRLAPNGPWHEAELLSDTVRSDRAGVSALLRAARSEFLLGDARTALLYLDRAQIIAAGSVPYDPAFRALVEFSVGNYGEASAWYAVAAQIADGDERAVLRTRAGLAAERAAMFEGALAYYRLAATDVPEFAGWLALRIATVAPPATALELTDRFPREAGALGARIHAAALARAGRTAAAESVLVASGMHWSAIELRIERGDTSDLTELLALALRGAPPPLSLDRSILRRLATESDSLALLSSRSLLRSEEYGLALELSAYVIERDSTAAGAQLIAGVSLEHLDRRAEALTAYAAATVPEARFRHARLLLRLRRYSEALAELLAFANETGEPSLAPAALELVADRHEAAGQLHAADSLRRVIADRYPGTVFGSHARVALARAGLRSGEDAVALAWLGREVAERGAARHEAMFEIGTILERVRDSVAADSVYRLLARSDSLGYWGLRARAAADLPLPVFAPPIRMPRSSRTATLFDQLDFLSSAGLENEFQALYDFISSGAEFDPVELTVVAEELIERGHTSDAIRLGWQASRQLGLNDIRVIRVVFPWPRRELIEAEAAEWGVDPFLVAAIIRQESAFEANATSRAGARGMMQLMPATARWRAQRMGHRWQDSFLGVPDANLHVGMAHLVALLNQYDELVHALAAYNAGGGNLARWRRNRESPSDPDLFVDFIPFPETREYVKAVRRNLDLYRALYPYRS